MAQNQKMADGFKTYGSMCHDGILEAFEEKARETDLFCVTGKK